MSIDNIQLNSYLCEKMFSKTLLDLTKTAGTGNNQQDVKKNLSKKIKINSLGDNERNILFLVNNNENKFLADDEMKLLTDLLQACKISMGDIALVNFYENREMNYQELLEQFQSKKILMFGVSAADLDLPFAIPFFQIQKFQEQIYMICPSLSDFINNVELKKDLWKSLKKIFSL